MKALLLARTFGRVLLLFSVLATTGCGGTGTGNPGKTTPDFIPTSSTQTSAGASAILDAICAKLSACYPTLSTTACRNGILPTTQIDTELGLSSGFGTYQHILDSEDGMTISVNAARAAICISDISALSCSAAGVVAAYTATAPTNFNNVYQLLPTGPVTSCPGVYQ